MSKAILAASVATAVAASLVSAAASAAAAQSSSASGRTRVTIAATSAITSYGSADPVLRYTVYGLTGRDKLTRKPTCRAIAHRNVGKYAIRCSGASARAKYTISYVGAWLYVGKSPLYVQPTYQREAYGDAAPTFTYTTYGLIRGDKLTRTPTCTVAGAHAAVGRYTIGCSGAAASGNYDLRSVGNYLDITKRPLLVGPDQKAIYFGDAEPAFTASSIGLVAGEKLVTEPTCGVAGEHVHVGSYRITCTGAEATSNYATTVVDNTYTVAANETVVVGYQASIGYNLLGQPTTATLRAQLYLGHPYGHVYPDQTLVFTAGDKQLCTAVTDHDGIATCELGANVSDLVANGSYTVTYPDQGPAGGPVDVRGSHHTVQNS